MQVGSWREVQWRLIAGLGLAFYIVYTSESWREYFRW